MRPFSPKRRQAVRFGDFHRANVRRFRTDHSANANLTCVALPGTTGAAVVSDLVEIACDLAAGRLSAKNVVGFLESRDLELAPEPKPAGWYLRLTVNDERGIIARVAETLSQGSMNIDSVQQEPHSPKEGLSLFFTVEPVSEHKVRSAIEKINAFEFIVKPVLLLRME